MTLLFATSWILIGGAIAGGVYWGFLITPVSTVLALTASAALAVVFLALIGAIVNGAIEIWSRGCSIAGVMRALRCIPAIIPAALIVLVLWSVTTRAELRVSQTSGQISAWFIARFGWSDVSWLFATIGFVAVWFRWVVAGMLGASMMAGVLAEGWSALTQAAWLRRALHPRSLGIATVAFVALIALPWTYLVPWRPANLPATSIELAFIVAKLSVAAILVAIGAALVVRQASVYDSSTVKPAHQDVAPATQ